MTEKKATHFPERTIATGVVGTGIGWLTTTLPLAHAELAGISAMVGGTALITAASWRWVAARRTTSGTIGRWSRRSRRNHGVASSLDHLKVSSSLAMRRRATVLRPSMASMGRWERWRTPVTQFATPLARSGRWTIWSPCEDITLRVGGPRTGKTGELACRIVDAPGAVIATSTRTDLLELTAPLRQQIGPVGLFNPSGLGGYPSTVKWSPLIGCRIPAIAARRAVDMIPPSMSAEAERWDSQARRILGILMHAAALGELPMQAVAEWVSDPNRVAAGQVAELLSRSSAAGPLQMAATQFFGLNERTKTSITATAAPALAWLTDERAAAIGDAHDDELLDVADLLEHRGTLYLLGAEDGIVAPLVAALTAEIAHQARMAAAGRPGGRLDPPLTIVLDEAAIICPVPLDKWSADFGGRNITIHVGAQSRAQLRQRWGDTGAAIILNNAASILVYGGTRDSDDLETWSRLSGEREEDVENTDADGKATGYSTRRVPVLSPAQIANLPAGTAMVVRRGMPVSLGRTTMAWKRKDIRRAIKANPYKAAAETTYAERDADSDGSSSDGDGR